MSERRLLSEPTSTLERDLLRSWEEERAPAEIRERTIRRVAALAGTATVSTAGATGLVKMAAASGKSAWGMASVLKGLAFAVLVGSAAYGVARATVDDRPLATPSSPLVAPVGVGSTGASPVSTTPSAPLEPAAEARNDDPAPPRASPLDAARPARRVAPVADTRVAKTVREPAPPTVRETPPSEPTPRPRAPRLGPELALLAEARAAIAARETDRALALLDTFGREYPASVLETEAEVVRMEARIARGERDKARALARDFVERHPGSPYLGRVEAIRDSR